MKGLYNTNRRS